MAMSETSLHTSAPNTFEERLQARLEALELEAPPAPRRRQTGVDLEVIDLDTAALAPTGHEATTDELNRQVKVLRHQLKGALEEVDRRLIESAELAQGAQQLAAASEARVLDADRRAARAEAQATEAAAQAVEAVTALHRIEEQLVVSSAADATESRLRLRSALDQLKRRVG